jgi:hypothetical protein
MTEQADDIKQLLELDTAYLSSEQTSDVARYKTFLALEFTASLPNYGLYG